MLDGEEAPAPEESPEAEPEDVPQEDEPEAAPVPPPEIPPKQEDYIMFREGKFFYLLIVGYVGIEVGLFVIVAITVYVSKRCKEENINWEMENFVINMDTPENLTKKF